jgi:hypothetical protein
MRARWNDECSPDDRPDERPDGHARRQGRVIMLVPMCMVAVLIDICTVGFVTMAVTASMGIGVRRD